MYPPTSVANLWVHGRKLDIFAKKDILVPSVRFVSFTFCPSAYECVFSSSTLWNTAGFPNPVSIDHQLARLKAKEIPVFPFYVCQSAKASFEKYARDSYQGVPTQPDSGSAAAFLDVNSAQGGELLADFITKRVLYSIGGDKGAALVASYNSIASDARSKGYVR